MQKIRVVILSIPVPYHDLKQHDLGLFALNIMILSVTLSAIFTVLN
jgi:hypothetical protein